MNLIIPSVLAERWTARRYQLWRREYFKCFRMNWARDEYTNKYHWRDKKYRHRRMTPLMKMTRIPKVTDVLIDIFMRCRPRVRKLRLNCSNYGLSRCWRLQAARTIHIRDAPDDVPIINTASNRRSLRSECESITVQRSTVNSPLDLQSEQSSVSSLASYFSLLYQSRSWKKKKKNAFMFYKPK